VFTFQSVTLIFKSVIHYSWGRLVELKMFTLSLKKKAFKSKSQKTPQDLAIIPQEGGLQSQPASQFEGGNNRRV
jgi:hypothetical protein